MARRILLVEDDPGVSAAISSLLRREDFLVTAVDSAEAALSQLEHGAFELILTDLKLPGLSGLDLLQRVRATHPRLPLVIMTGHGTTDTAIDATKSGAYDYLIKPVDPVELMELADGAVAQAQLMFEPVSLGESTTPGVALVGQSRIMQTLCKEIGRVASTSLPVLILGETGTGKELVARALYRHSSRADRPFLAVNGAALPETLLESELFGHERGAFTGADRQRIGRFEQVQGGTLFLDEVGDLSPVSQAKLLRVIEDGTLYRLGGTEPLQVDVRLVTATHRDLERAVALGSGFREDLFFRLSVVTLRVPPLRDRREDIPAVVEHLIRRHAAACNAQTLDITAEAVRHLEMQPWPGNVRQLENVIRQALIHARPKAIGLEHVQRALAPPRTPVPTASRSHGAFVGELLERARRGEISDAHSRMVGELEAELFTQAIRLAGGNQAQVARWLGVTRLKVREKLRELRMGSRGNAEGAEKT